MTQLAAGAAAPAFTLPRDGGGKVLLAEMLEAYGVWGTKSTYGKTFMGIVRTTFLIGPDRRIARIWPKVKVDGHAEEVLAAAKAL